MLNSDCYDNDEESGNSLLSTIWGIAVVVIGVMAMILFVPAFCFMAMRGTKGQVTSVALPARATPLYPTLHDGETANLLTSSEVPIYCGSEEFPHGSNYSVNFGTLARDSAAAPSTSRFKSYISGST